MALDGADYDVIIILGWRSLRKYLYESFVLILMIFVSPPVQILKDFHAVTYGESPRKHSVFRDLDDANGN